MATTREEVQIRLGVDAKAMQMGLDSANGYLKKWLQKDKASEREYTQFWKAELDKREKMEIESVTRGNKARALLRERAEKRDAAAVQSMAGNRAGGEGFVSAPTSAFGAAAIASAGKKTVSLLKASVFLAVMDLFGKLIPEAQAFWDGIYGTDAESMKKHDAALQRIKSFVASVKAAQQSVEDAANRRIYGNASPEKQVSMSQADVDLQKNVVASAKQTLAELKSDLAFTKGTKAIEARNELLWKYGEALKRVSVEQEKQIQLEERAEQARNRMWAANPPTLVGPNYSKQALMNTMLPLTNLPFMGGLKGAIDKTNVGIAIFEAIHRKPMSVIIKGVDGP